MSYFFACEFLVAIFEKMIKHALVCFFSRSIQSQTLSEHREKLMETKQTSFSYKTHVVSYKLHPGESVYISEWKCVALWSHVERTVVSTEVTNNVSVQKGSFWVCNCGCGCTTRMMTSQTTCSNCGCANRYTATHWTCGCINNCHCGYRMPRNEPLCRGCGHGPTYDLLASEAEFFLVPVEQTGDLFTVPRTQSDPFDNNPFRRLG